jgi:hypothetical protein
MTGEATRRTVPRSGWTFAYGVQLAILAVLLLIYCMGTLVYLRSWILVLAGLALPATSGLIGKAMAGTRGDAMEAALVWIVGTLGISFLSISIHFPVTGPAAALMAICSFVLLGTWALHRFPAEDSVGEQQLAASVLVSVLIGFATAVFVGLFATAIFLIGFLSGEEPFTLQNWSLLILSYVAAGVIGGVLVGLTRPLTAYPLGRMLVGIPVAAVIYGFVGIGMLFMGIDGGPETLRTAIVMGMVMGLIAGPMGGLVFYGAGATGHTERFADRR